MGKKHFCFLQTAETGKEPRTLAWKAAVLNTTLGPPPSFWVSLKCLSLLGTEPGCQPTFLEASLFLADVNVGNKFHFWSLAHIYVSAAPIRWPSVGMKLGQRRRRWPNIKPALDRFLWLLCSCAILTSLYLRTGHGWLNYFSQSRCLRERFRLLTME